MSVNNSSTSDNVVRNVATVSNFGNTGLGIVSQSIPINHQTHLVSHPRPHPHPHPQPQPQSLPLPRTQGGSHFTGHFQVSETQSHGHAQSQYTQTRAQAPAQALHTPFQSQLQAQAQSLAQLHSANTSNFVTQSTSVSTPGTGSAKRISQKPPSRPTGSSNINSALPFKTMELTPATRRKKQKHSDKKIPDKVAALLPESALYSQLLEFEARVDAALARKKIDIEESLKNPLCHQKTLRIYVFNTFVNQIQTSPNTSPNKASEPSSWSLKIIGRILEDGIDPVIAGPLQKSSSSNPKFSSFFKKITIYLDQTLYPDNHVILWESSRSPVLNEGFEVKRKGDKEFSAIIRLEMNYFPEKFKLSQALSDLLGIEMDTRPRIIASIWHYVKVKGLQNSNDPSFFACDPALQKVFGEEKMKFSMVLQKLSQHLTSPRPIHIEHKIKLSGTCPSGTTCYDVLIDVPFPMEKEMSAFLANTDRNKEIDACDERICGAIKKLQEHNRRRSFFTGFSQSPAEFINNLISSQNKDLKLVAGDANQIAEEERFSNFYNQSWVDDAVIRYLNRKSTGSDAPGTT